MDVVENKIKVMVEKRHRELLATTYREIEAQANKIVKENIRVPDLIGEYCPYSTFASFMSAFHKSTTSHIADHTTKIVSLQNLND